MSLTRDQMLSTTERRYLDVLIPEHGGSVRVVESLRNGKPIRRGGGKFQRSQRLRFIFRLALALGHYDPFGMLDQCPELLDYWIAFSDIEPFGEERADLRNALLGTAVCSSLGAKIESSMFMPFSKIEPEVQSPELQLAKVRTIVAAHNSGRG